MRSRDEQIARKLGTVNLRDYVDHLTHASVRPESSPVELSGRWPPGYKDNITADR